MDKHKNIINLLGVCTQDGEGAVQVGLGQEMVTAQGCWGQQQLGCWAEAGADQS